MDNKKIQKKFTDIPEEKENRVRKKDKVQLLVDEIKKTYNLDVELSKNVKYKIEKIIEYINSKYNYRYNIINTETEYKLKNEKEWKYFDDRDYRSCFNELKLNNISVTDQDFKSLVYSENISEPFNPFMEYFNSLPKWKKGDEDFISRFLDQVYLKDETQRKYFEKGFRKWFVALVMSLIEDTPSPYYINQTCLILVGGQGKYKTTFLKNIIPQHLQLKYFYGSSFQVHNKDHEKYLAYKIIINLDEMAAYNKTDVESIKSKITQDQVVLRLPYAKADIHLKRRASFTGTQNNTEFLKDDTGSRRWLVIEIDRIIIDNNFNVDKMYAQALELYRSGEKYWFDYEDIKGIEAHNEQYHLKGFETQLIERHYRIPTKEEWNEDRLIQYYTATDIAMHLSNKYNKINVNNTVVKNIGSSLKKLGFKKRGRKLNGTTTHLWALYEIDTPKNEAIESNAYNSNEELF